MLIVWSQPEVYLFLMLNKMERIVTNSYKALYFELSQQMFNAVVSPGVKGKRRTQHYFSNCLY